MSVNKKIEERQRIWGQMQDLLKRAKSENERPLSADELEQFRKADLHMTSLKNEIDVETRAADLEKEFLLVADLGKEEKRKSGDQENAYDKAFDRFIRNGKSGLSTEERKLLSEKRGTNTQITTTDSLGGYLVKDLWANKIESSLKQFGGVMEVSDVFNTDSGGDFHIPLDDNRDTIGAGIGQNIADVVSDETFGEAIMKAHVVTSGWIKATQEQLTDSGYNLEKYIYDRIAERIHRKTNKWFTTGVGTTEPFGVVTQSGLGGTTAGIAAVTRAEILGLIHSVDPAYRKSKSCKIMCNDNTVLGIKLLTVGSGDDRPLWQPSIIQGAPDKLEGFDIIINQDMASRGTGNKFMLFGDFSRFHIRKVWDIQLQVSAEKYIDSRAMAYNGYARYDSLLATPGAIKHLKNA